MVLCVGASIVSILVIWAICRDNPLSTRHGVTTTPYPREKKKNGDVNSIYQKENEVLRKENDMLRQWASELLFSIEHLKEGEQALAVQEWRELNWVIYQELIENTPKNRVGMLNAFNRSNGETSDDKARGLAEVDNMIAVRRMINGDFD